MSNLENELRAAGFTPVPIESRDGAIKFTGWKAPLMEDVGTGLPCGYCTVCGCNAAYCGGPTELGDLDPDTSLCGCYDDELGEPVC